MSRDEVAARMFLMLMESALTQMHDEPTLVLHADAEAKAAFDYADAFEAERKRRQWQPIPMPEVK
jgi:hypothetical protein